ncbi:hypothetical protein NMG60_11022983 [Bertholletia excelsa]
MATATVACLTVIALLVTVVASAAPAATVYTNHTVGDNLGWFFNATTNTSSANYTSWAAKQTFNLGDYLIFNTNSNQTVIQTYNESTYSSCSADDASDSDTFQYDGGSNVFGQLETIAVPLTIEGANYYFSDAGDDGVQCQQGMAFEIVVNHGLGLPPSLNQPPPPPYKAPPSPPDAQSPPITVVPTQDMPNGGGSKAAANLRSVITFLLIGGSLLV